MSKLNLTNLSATKKLKEDATLQNNKPFKNSKNNKDDIKNFIDSELGKFQMKQQLENKNLISVKQDKQDDNQTINKSISIKENMKKIKDLKSNVKINESSSKSDDMFKTSTTKFPQFKMTDNSNSNFKSPDDTFNSSSNDFLRITGGANNKSKNPFIMKKFDNNNNDNILKKEIIEDLNNKVDIEYYEDFIDDEELKNLEKKTEIPKNENKIITNINNDNKSINLPTEIEKLTTSIIPKTKKQEIIERIKNLGIELEEENFANLYEFDNNEKNFKIAQNIAKGLYKNEIVQTNEMESKGVETEKFVLKEMGTCTEGQNNEIINNNLENNVNNKNVSIPLIDPLENSNINKNNITTYQPLSLETYKFFIKFSPFIEKIIMNNINKYILQTPGESQELKAFSKLEKEYIISEDLINYVNINKQKNHEVTFNSYLFFDTNPMLIGISISIKFFNETENKSSNIFSSDSNLVNLIVIYNLFSNKEEKLFYSFSKVTHMILLGNSENILITCNEERNLEIFDIKNNFEKFCHLFETNGINPTFNNEINNEEDLKIKLKLNTISNKESFSSSLIGMHKKILENKNNSKNKNCKIFLMDSSGYLIIYENSIELNFNDLNKFPLKKNFEFNLKNKLERIFNINTNEYSFNSLKCLEFKLSLKNSNYFSEIIYILTNYGLAKIIIEGKDEILINVIFNNESEFNKISTFDISDTGHLILAFVDFSVKIIDENNFSTIFQTCVSTLSYDTVINKIVFANIIGKNEKSRLIRKNLIANFYVITSKNEFIIFDMNQKNKTEIKKIKKKLELGQKKGLTGRNSLISFSDSLFTDYSNYILQSINKEKKVEFYKLSLRKQFYDVNNIKGINDKIIEKILK